MAVEQTEVDPAVDELMGRLIQDFAGAGSIPLTMIGYVAYHPESGRFSLPAEAAAVLADDATSAFIGADLPAWLAALDGLDDRLRSGARVADVGCGYGAPTIVMAQTHPASRFWGFDYHDASIARARKAVTARLRDAIARVGRQHPALGRHLTDTVSTGTWCAYTPPTPVDWEL
jgi:SAM-dependent methyltransferase